MRWYDAPVKLAQLRWPSAAALLASGCTPYSGPVTLNVDELTAAVGGYAIVHAQIFDGSRAPRVLSGIRARCEDETICQTVVVHHERGDEVRIAGKRAGTTWVVVDWMHPVRNKPGSGRVKATFVEGRSVELRVGAPAVTEQRLVLLTGPGSQRWSCSSSTAGTFRYNGFVWDSVIHDRVRLFECEKPFEVIAGQPSFYDYQATPNRWYDHPFGSTVLVCATITPTEQRWASVDIYSRDGQTRLSRQGIVPAKLCQRTPGGS
jgi:hypothetical protein